MKILIACEFSGIVRDAFAARGHDAWSCDLLPTERPGNHYQCDVFEVLGLGWDMMIAHPPCTYLSSVGNSWLDESKYGDKARKRKQDRKDAIDFFMGLIEAPINFIVVENPVGIMSTVYRKPDQIIQPYWFGDKEKKKTCLWVNGAYKNITLLKKTSDDEEPKPKYIGRNGRKMFFVDSQPATKDRAKIRSKTFQGVADAMAAQWGDL